MAMPCTAPVSTSVTWPAIRSETRLPALLVWSSVIAVKLLAPVKHGPGIVHVGDADRRDGPLPR